MSYLGGRGGGQNRLYNIDIYEQIIYNAHVFNNDFFLFLLIFLSSIEWHCEIEILCWIEPFDDLIVTK